MNSRILIVLIIVGTLSARFSEFIKEASNPNGEPFMMSLGIEKNVHSFKYYNESTFYVTLPVSNIVTLKYRENVTYQEDMVVLQSEHDMIQELDKHYSLEFHLPLYKLWK
jgi:hypothetical protein